MSPSLAYYTRSFGAPIYAVNMMCSQSTTPKLAAARCWVLLCSRRSVGQYWAAHQRLGTVALHHPPATRPPPLASTSPSLTSSHSTPSLSSSRGLSTSCHRPAPGHTRCTVRIFWPRSWPRHARGHHHYHRRRGGWRMWVNYRKLHLSESSWTFNKVLSASLRQDQWQCGLSPP